MTLSTLGHLAQITGLLLVIGIWTAIGRGTAAHRRRARCMAVHPAAAPNHSPAPRTASPTSPAGISSDELTVELPVLTRR